MKNKQKRSLLIVLAMGCIFSCLIFTACTEAYVYKNDQPIKEEGWPYEQEVNFTIDAPDTIHWYRLELDVNHQTDFGYQNVYLYIDTGFPSDTTLTDLINLDLAKTSGEWHGKCNRTSCVNNYMLQKKFRFEQLGKYQFNFRQASRQDSLRGINSISLGLKKLANDDQEG